MHFTPGFTNTNFAYITQHRVTSASSSGLLDFMVNFHCVWSISGLLIVYQDGDYLYLGQYNQTICWSQIVMIPPLRRKHWHGKTQYIPGKKVLVRSCQWKIYYCYGDHKRVLKGHQIELKMLGHCIKYWPSKLLQPYFWYFCTNCIICNFKLVQCYLLCRYNARVVKMVERTVLMTLKTDIAKFEDRSIITFVKPTNAAQLKLATNPHLLLPSPQSCVSLVLQKYAHRNMLNML